MAGGLRGAATNIQRYVEDNLAAAAKADEIGSKPAKGSGRARKPVSEVVRPDDWDNTPAEELREMLSHEEGQRALAGLSNKNKKIVRRRLYEQNKLWGEQFDHLVFGKAGPDFDPSKDLPKSRGPEEKTSRTGGNSDYDSTGRSEKAIAEKLKREGADNEKRDVRNTGRALEDVTDARRDAEKPLTTADINRRERRSPGPAAAGPLDLNPPLDRSGWRGTGREPRGSEVIAGGGDGSQALPVAQRTTEVGLPDKEIVLREPEVELEPPKRKSIRVRVGKGPNKLDAKPRAPEYRAPGTRTSGRGKSATGDTVNENRVSESSRERRRRDAANAAGFYPNAADSAKRLSSDEIEEAKMDHGSSYGRLGVSHTQSTESRFGTAQKEVLKNFPEDGEARLSRIAGAKSPEHAYDIAFKHARAIVENDMPGERISSSAARDAMHGMASTLVRGYGWEIPNVMPPGVRRGDDAASQADVVSGNIRPPTSSALPPAPEPNVRDFLRDRARRLADRRLKARDSSKVREQQPVEFGMRDAPETETRFAEPVGPRQPGTINEASLAEYEAKLNEITKRPDGPADAPAKPQVEPPRPTDPEDLASEIDDPFTGSEDALPVQVNAAATRQFRDLFPLPGRKPKAAAAGGGGTKPPATATTAPAGDEGLPPVPDSGRQRSQTPAVNVPKSELRAAAKRDDGTTVQSRREAVRGGWSPEERALRGTDRDAGMADLDAELRGLDNDGPSDADLMGIDPNGYDPGAFADVPDQAALNAAVRDTKGSRKPRKAATTAAVSEPPPAAGTPPAAPPSPRKPDAGQGQAGVRAGRGRQAAPVRPAAPPPASPPPSVPDNVVLGPGEDGGWAFRARGGAAMPAAPTAARADKSFQDFLNEIGYDDYHTPVYRDEAAQAELIESARRMNATLGMDGADIDFDMPEGASSPFDRLVPHVGRATPYDPNTGAATPYDPNTGAATPYDPNSGLATPYDPNTGAASPYDNPLIGSSSPFDPFAANIGKHSKFDPVLNARVGEHSPYTPRSPFQPAFIPWRAPESVTERALRTIRSGAGAAYRHPYRTAGGVGALGIGGLIINGAMQPAPDTLGDVMPSWEEDAPAAPPAELPPEPSPTEGAIGARRSIRREERLRRSREALTRAKNSKIGISGHVYAD
jgi:hypothetical protein